MIKFFSMMFFLVACGTTSKSPNCVDHGQCNEGQACMEGECAPADCLGSTECGLGEYCSPSEFTCKSGCMDDGDCFAGEECNLENRTCVSYGCRSTALDCSAGEFCDTDSDSNTFGECYKDPRNHCKVCDVDANNCPNGMDCFIFELGDACFSDNDCSNNWSCDMMSDFNFYCHKDRCLSKCNPNQTDTCPAGFSCGDTSGFGEYYCIADCAYLKDNGHI